MAGRIVTSIRRRVPGRGAGRWRVLLGSLLAGLLIVDIVGGCANLPDSSAPQALKTLDHEPTSQGPPAPISGRDPDLLLRDFLQATADPTNRHGTARQYLTPAAAANWDDGAGTEIVEKPDMLRESRSNDAVVYRIRAHKVGDLAANGSYRAGDSTLESKIEMSRVGNDWRIDQLQPGVVVDSAAFAKSYRRYSLYFANTTGNMMVSDMRWIVSRKDQLAERLIGMLAAGPEQRLAPAVRNVLSGGVSVKGPISRPNGDTAGVGIGLGGVQIDFSGTAALDQHNRELLAAQAVLTLSNADVYGPYLLLGDGKPLDERFAGVGWSVGDVSALNPANDNHNRIGLHAVRDGSLVLVDTVKNEIVPTPGYFGNAHNLQSVGLSRDGQLVAAVADSGQSASDASRTLVIGSYDGNAFPVAQGKSFTRPSWTDDGGSAWIAVDGERIIRAVHDRVTGNVSVQDVDTTDLFAAPADASEPSLRPPITELRIDRTGTRAALIAAGKAYVAVVVPRPDGKFALTAPIQVAIGLSNAVVSLDWYGSDTIVFVREGNVDPVETILLDGSEPTPLTSQNLTPPVRVVSASAEVVYAADMRAVMQLQSAEPSSERLWREVQGLGATAVPVLPG